MRKEFLIIALVIFILIFAGIFLHKGENDDVSIAALNTPPAMGLDVVGQLEVVIQNNESHMVDISLDVKNAFVDDDGRSISTSRMMISGISGENQDKYDHNAISGKVPLSPGENRVLVLIGYEATGTYDVEVKLYQNEQVIDEKVTSIRVLPPKLSLELEYTEKRSDDVLIYMIEGYILNEGPGRAEDVDTTITISDLESREVLSSENYQYDVGGNSKTSLRDWRDLPAAIIELSNTGVSDESYMPLKSVVKGKTGEAYLVTVEVNWNEQDISSELIIPDSNDLAEESL
ncbi:hypothetical protein [Methanococcoides burtonii]|uniref:Uncharacterized protein n=1 Tax=Methanococcoides burtonii (strain DSM 6242 / NBRC 107633 / OCM 468 / ACE-M) TaxID=259564 RepID=Q12WQ3_METBU|nr:hypothetical protein [Methanococcoides burtonii]ABE52123.1 Hypothetical protein Mbur_1200 [Methanococcoides burtonii DSM 6242]